MSTWTKMPVQKIYCWLVSHRSIQWQELESKPTGSRKTIILGESICFKSLMLPKVLQSFKKISRYIRLAMSYTFKNTKICCHNIIRDFLWYVLDYIFAFLDCVHNTKFTLYSWLCYFIKGIFFRHDYSYVMHRIQKLEGFPLLLLLKHFSLNLTISSLFCFIFTHYLSSYCMDKIKNKNKNKPSVNLCTQISITKSSTQHDGCNMAV